MNHKFRAMLFTLAACLFVVPTAFAANTVDGLPAMDVPPLISTPVLVDIENDVDLRGVGFGYVLANVSATSAVVDSVTVVLTELGSRRLPAGAVFMAGRTGADDLATGDHPGAVLIWVTLDGLTAEYAELTLGGVDPWPGNAIFVDNADAASRILVDPFTITITVKAGVVVNLDGVCPTYGQTYEGGGVAVQVSASVNDGVFASLDLVSMSGTPVNAPVVTAWA